MNQDVNLSSYLGVFRDYLICEERAAATIEKYVRDIRFFIRFIPPGQPLMKEAVLQYKQSLLQTYKTASANSMLVAVNRFLEFIGRRDCQIKLYKIQQSPIRKREKELTKEEYRRLVLAAKQKQSERLSLLIQAICSTGIRVSEHRFITRESLKSGIVSIRNKGKERSIFLSKELCRELLIYCRRKGIYSGPVFITRNGKPLNRCNIWAEMKGLCRTANVSPEKVYPHNLRHLFALTYYRLEKNIAHLADILGHSSMENTRIYTSASDEEHIRILSRLNLLI
jgi:integrase/recombinase XerD